MMKIVTSGKYVFLSLLSVLIFLLFPTQTLWAQIKQDTTSYSLQPLHIKKDFDITGKLTNADWKEAKTIYIKYEVQPNDEGLAKVTTKVKTLYSKNYLYIGFICSDPHPRDIRAHVADRDQDFNDDYIGIILDPFDNNQHGYELFVNPLGIQMDGIRNSDNNEDMNFDALWYSKGAINDTGYTAVMKIPFKSLNFPNRKIQNWSIQFIRNYPRSTRYIYAWTHVNINNPCIMCQSGQLADMTNVKNTNTVEILPYAIGYQGSTINNSNDPSSGLDNKPVNGRIGGSISYSPTSTTSINAVINPDFSQVETDATQISANQTFALYYPEKRPFFMKGADLFNTPEDLYYSRMINHPLTAGKFIENASKYTLAFLTAYDRNAPFIIPGLQRSSLIKSDVHAYSNVLRGKYNIGSESYIGGLLTTRNQGQGYNYVGSIDWSLLLADHYYFSGQAAYSDTKELNDTTLFNDSRIFGTSKYDATFNGQHFGGTLLSTEFSRQAKYYNFSIQYQSYSPTFQTQEGFINKTDRRVIQGNQSFSYYPGTWLLSRGDISVHGFWRYDFNNLLQERWLNIGWNNHFAGQTQLYIGLLPLNDEQFNGYFFTKLNRIMFNLNSNALNAFSFGGHFETGHYIYRADKPKTGHGYSVSANATFKPTPRLHLSLDYSYSTLSSLDNKTNYYSGDIFRLNSRYNFSRKLFARFITQYDSFNKQIQVYPLVYYKLNPFTIFYAGMTDYMDNFNEPNGFNGYKQTNREFFVKFQYLIRS
ncbi:MAG TPA: sugar-binding protein [Balneolales bacterium]|nr:sugar-binding protein [Balneolales bacterium]